MPVSFDLNAREVAEVRKTLDVFRSGASGWTLKLNLVLPFAYGGLLLSSRGWQDKPSLAFMGAYLVLIAIAMATRFQRLSDIKPQTESVVSFDADGIRLARHSRFVRTVAYTRIARVRLLESALVIESRWLPAIGIPRRALPSDGAQLIEFFEDRLVGKSMLQRQPQSTTIVNTATT